MAEQFRNLARTTLSSALSDSATSVPVTDGSKLSATGAYSVAIGDPTDPELVRVSARSGNTLTVVRGQGGTAARAHASGAVVAQVVSAEAIAALRAEVLVDANAYADSAADGVLTEANTHADTVAGAALTSALAADVSLTGAAPAAVTKAAAAIGVATAAARADHKHDISTAAPGEIIDGSTPAEGTATSLARSDHQHTHGNRAGGSLHSAATDSVAGFMSAADKTKLDAIPEGGGSVNAAALAALGVIGLKPGTDLTDANASLQVATANLYTMPADVQTVTRTLTLSAPTDPSKPWVMCIANRGAQVLNITNGGGAADSLTPVGAGCAATFVWDAPGAGENGMDWHNGAYWTLPP